MTILNQVPEDVIFGQSEAMSRLRDRVLKVAATAVPVLIIGESGTGKGVFANLIHQKSTRRSGPYVVVNCPAVPEHLIESELFGYERGAFTGAYERKTGLVESAHDGSLFLDEIGEMALGLQAKLLHLLQDGTFMRIGGFEEQQADIRVLCATNRRLKEDVDLGTFRSDLFYRLNVVSLELPPLRERRQDIRILVNYFMNRYCNDYKRDVPPISSRLMKLFEQYDWPGNVRELENVIKRYAIFGSEDAIANDLLGYDRVNLSESQSLKNLTREAVREFERNIILDVLYANNWNRKQAARILKISYRALFYKIKNSGIPQKRAAGSVAIK